MQAEQVFASPVDAPRSYLFAKHQTLFHVKTGGRYCIVGTPDEYVIEATREPAYAYRAWVEVGKESFKEGKEIWVRSQKEMEDGRFSFPDGVNLTLVPKPQYGEQTLAAIKQLNQNKILIPTSDYIL